MKIMDNSVEDDCKIEAVVTMTKKKLKQARLPFQMLSSTDLPVNGVNKKRKLSPPVESKSSKILKTTVKENDVKEGDSHEICIDVNTKSVRNEKDMKTTDEEMVKSQIKDKSPSKKQGKRSRTTPRKTPLAKTRKLENKANEKSSVLKFMKTPDKHNDSDHDDNVCETDITDHETIPKKEEKEELDSTNVSIENDSICIKSDCEMFDVSSDNEKNDITIQSGDNTEIDVTDETPKTPVSRRSIENMKHQKLTPKQLEKKMQIEKKREEKQKLKMEREKKKEEERENRQKLKEERRRRKEEKDKAEKEQKKKEKELKEFKKQMEIEQKQKEKEAKEEERRKKEEAKEEEKRKKEEEKLEAERRKQKAALNFASFFLAKKQESKTSEEESIAEIKNFMPFEIKADMRIAPICRRILNVNEKIDFDKKFRAGNAKRSNLYLQEIKSEGYVLHKSKKTWPLEGKDDVIVIDEESDGDSNVMDQAGITVEKHRPKLLQFTENQRPPYWGTWRKESNTVTARTPFSKDSKWFDYEIDSDEEWEEEEPGESLRGSDDEKDEENPEDNEYDVDNEFMVPHGYLSDEEARADEEEREDMSPETQKFKLKILGEQFEAERNTKTSKLKPRIIGCVWQGANNSFPENVPPKVVEFLSARQAWVRQIPITLPSTLEFENAATSEYGTPTQQPGTSRKTKVPKEALADLIRLIHGNTHGRKFLVKEFMTFWSKKNRSDEKQLSKVSLLHKIREIAKWMNCPEEGPMHLKTCWYVFENVRKQYLPADEEVTLPNRWTYILTPKGKSDIPEVSDKPDREEKEKEKEREREKKNVPLITQFTKKITQEEMKKQLITKPVEIVLSKEKPPQQKSPKRVTLISVGRGEQFPMASRESLLTKFVSNETAKDAEFRESNKSDASDSAVITNKNNEANDNKKSDRDTHSDVSKTEPLGEKREQQVPDVRMTNINDSNLNKKKKIRQDIKKRKRKVKEKKGAIFLSSNSFKKSTTNKGRQATVCVVDIDDMEDD